MGDTEVVNILEGIQTKVRENRYEFSKHALDQSILRDITVAEIKEALLSKIELVEDYPDDYYGPSCLLLGVTVQGKPIHVVCSYPSRPYVKLITVYQPAETEWENYRTRK